MTRVLPIVLVSGGLVAAAAAAPSALAAASPDDPAVQQAVAAATTDYSTLVADAEEKRATPAKLGPWSYTEGLFLYGTYLVYQRTHNTKYLTYMQQWADRFVDSKGHLNNGLSSLDSMQSGNVLLELYKETKQAKYRTAATQIRNRLNSWPTTKDGGFWHADVSSRAHQLWADGTYMVLPFLLHYGQIVGDTSYADSTAVKQLNVYYSHLADPATSLLRHAYDESKTQSWANKTTGQAPEDWCRAIGWFGMASIEALDIVPANQAGRADVLSHLQTLIAGYKKWQDPATGRWFQLPAKPTVHGNWLETSCSSMFTYTISRAVEKGYVDAGYKPVAAKGYQGVLTQVSKTGDVSNICIGTNVGNQAYYLGRPRATNDLHGLGAFLIMNEQLARTT